MVTNKPDEFVEVPNKFFITILIMAAALMQTIDATIANVALPRMQGSLSATQDEISWVLTSYIVASAITIPLTGWLAGRFGRKYVFLISVTIFTLASVLCGSATSLTEIVLFRILQGMSGAALVPLSQAILFDINRKEDHGKAMAMWGLAITMGPIIGPVVGGWLTDNYNWRWVFYINVPIGLFVMFGLWFSLPDTKKILGKFDFIGYAGLALSIGALQIMLDRGQREDWFNSKEIITEAIVMIVAFYMFVIHSATHSRPFLSIELFKDRNFLISNILMFLLGIILFSTLALVPSMLQIEMGYPVFTTGLVTAPRGVGALLSMMFVGIMINKVDSRYIISAGLVLIVISLWQMIHFSLYMNEKPVIVSGIIQGFGIGLSMVPLGVSAFLTLPVSLRNEGTAFFALIRNLGGSVGISVVVTLLTRNTQILHSSLSEHITPYIDIVPSSKIELAFVNAQITKQAAMIAYINNYKFLMILAIIFMPLVFLLDTKKNISEKEEILAME
jgi:DHA2 family multidrug resistance protein